MKTRQIIKVSLIVMIFSLFTYSFTYFGASAISYPNNVEPLYSEHTFIGSIDVSNKTKDEIKVLLEEKWTDWTANAKVALVYKEHSYPVTAKSITLDINQTVHSVIDGQQNELFIQLESLNDVLPDTILKQLDNELLESDLTDAIQSINKKIVIDIARYLPKEEPIEVSAISYQLESENDEIVAFIDSFPAIEVEAESLFSLANFVRDSESPELSDHAYSQIATAIYQAILPTNFLISERYISRKLPESIEPGFEAKVQFGKSMDFSIYNPNISAYKIEFDWKNPNLEVSVKGAPFLYKYSIQTLDKQEYKPRLIKQYSPLLNSGQKTVKVEGNPGVIVKVVRETYSEKGELMKTEVLSEDFYPPVHRIEVHPLGIAAVETETGTTEGSDSVVLPDDGGTDVSQDQSVGETSPDIDGNENDDEAETEEDSLFGKPNEEPK